MGAVIPEQLKNFNLIPCLYRLWFAQTNIVHVLNELLRVR